MKNREKQTMEHKQNHENMKEINWHIHKMGFRGRYSDGVKVRMSAVFSKKNDYHIQNEVKNTLSQNEGGLPTFKSNHKSNLNHPKSIKTHQNPSKYIRISSKNPSNSYSKSIKINPKSIKIHPKSINSHSKSIKEPFKIYPKST